MEQYSKALGLLEEARGYKAGRSGRRVPYLAQKSYEWRNGHRAGCEDRAYFYSQDRIGQGAK